MVDEMDSTDFGVQRDNAVGLFNNMQNVEAVDGDDKKGADGQKKVKIMENKKEAATKETGRS